MEDKAAALERRLALKTRSPERGWGSVPLSSAKIAQAIEQQDQWYAIEPKVWESFAEWVRIPMIAYRWNYGELA